MKEVFMERYFDRIAGLFIALGNGNTNIFQGHVIEEGKHDELIAKGGYYADLVKFQLQ